MWKLPVHVQYAKNWCTKVVKLVKQRVVDGVNTSLYLTRSKSWERECCMSLSLLTNHSEAWPKNNKSEWHAYIIWDYLLLLIETVLTWWDVRCHAFSFSPAQSFSTSWKRPGWPRPGGSQRSGQHWTRPQNPPEQWRSWGAYMPASNTSRRSPETKHEKGNIYCSFCVEKKIKLSGIHTHLETGYHPNTQTLIADQLTVFMRHMCLELCPEIAKGLTHHVDKVDNFKYPISQLSLIFLHLQVL